MVIQWWWWASKAQYCTFEKVFLTQIKDLPLVDETSEFASKTKLEQFLAKDILIRVKTVFHLIYFTIFKMEKSFFGGFSILKMARRRKVRRTV